MFENLLHQKPLANHLSDDISIGRLPNSMLFTGEANGGKLTAALELARVLGCDQEKAPWSCSCSSCRQHRLLDSPYLLMMGQRDFVAEIRAAGDMLQKFSGEDDRPLRFLFYRNCKKLIRRFDPLLWQDDSTKLNKAEKLITALEELLEPVHPEKLASDRSSVTFEKIYDAAAEIAKILPADGITINMIRRAVYWSHTADSARPKLVILENAHEMNEASRNAFLKVLEEPPAAVYFILLTDRPGAIIPTIRSRLREYRFAPRGISQAREIISRIYRCETPEDYSSITGFFIDSQPGGIAEYRKRTSLMFRFLAEKSVAARDELAAHLGSDRAALRSLVALCLEEIQASHISNREFMGYQRKLEEIQYKCDIYNIPVASALDSGYI